MTATEKVQEILIGAAAVTALVPAARIRVPGPWQNLALPYIQHFPVSVDPTITHGALAQGRGWRYQIDIFAASYSTGEAVAIAVRDAVHGVHADSPATEGLTALFSPGLWYVGTEGAAQNAPAIEHFAVEFQLFEGLV